MIKSVFFDIDGTLLSFQTHKVPQSAKDAMRQAKQKGCLLFICTGRHHAAIPNEIKELPFDGYITLNGQYCFVEDNVIRKQPIASQDIQILKKRLQSEPFPCEWIEENHLYINFVDSMVRKAHEAVDMVLPELRDVTLLGEEPVYQLLTFLEPSKEAWAMRDLPHCRSTRWSPHFADVTPTDGDKCEGIKSMLQQFGLQKEEAAAFGDGNNDIAMLKHVAAGIAMGGSAKEVQDAAAFVTASVEEDGIKKGLIALGLAEA